MVFSWGLHLFYVLLRTHLGSDLYFELFSVFIFKFIVCQTVFFLVYHFNFWSPLFVRFYFFAAYF